MIRSITGFPHYRYDDQRKVVLSMYNKVEELKWLIIQKQKRVTLWENKKPHYLFEKAIIAKVGDEKAVEILEKAPKVKKEKRVKVSDFEKDLMKEVDENEVERQMNKEDNFEQKWQIVLDFFRIERKDKKCRRDFFQQKFGKEFLEECLKRDLLEITKIWAFYFYSI